MSIGQSVNDIERQRREEFGLKVSGLVSKIRKSMANATLETEPIPELPDTNPVNLKRYSAAEIQQALKETESFKAKYNMDEKGNFLFISIKAQ